MPPFEERPCNGSPGTKVHTLFISVVPTPPPPQTDGQEHASFSYSSDEGARSCQQKEILTLSSKEQPVPWRSNHLDIGAHTFQVWLQEGHFMYPASNSHTGCVANNIILEAVSGTEWLQIFFKNQIQVSSDLKRQVITLCVQLKYPVWLLPRNSQLRKKKNYEVKENLQLWLLATFSTGLAKNKRVFWHESN